jgi:Secretion system C-terminal sorting domain
LILPGFGYFLCGRSFGEAQWVVSNEYNGGMMLGTTDGGITWTQQIIGTTNPLWGVVFADALTGWAVGDNGTILHTTNGGVTSVKEEQTNVLPTEFMLSQNYPNPLNPSTKIRYSVPRSSNVMIKVFNILGAEIETLVNEEKSAGTYELTWNAANLPSGVYFYRIQAGSFVATKKMMLLK